MIFLKIDKKNIFNKKNILLIAGFALLITFITMFFLTMAQPDYWHFMDTGSYLSRSFFAVEKGFFQELPYWNYGYNYISFEIYPPFFFIVSTAFFYLLSLIGFPSIYWAFFAAFISSYFVGFFLSWKVSRKAAIAFLLVAGNIFTLGMLVLMGFNIKLFAFNLCFPAIAFLLANRTKLKFDWKIFALFSITLAILFATHFYLFILFSLFYLGILFQNKAFKGLLAFVFVPVLTFPYFISFVSFLMNPIGVNDIPVTFIGFSLNFYIIIFLAFIALFLIKREIFMIPLALLAGIFVLNLNGISLLSNLEMHSTALFLLGIICYYAVEEAWKAISKIKKVSHKKILKKASWTLLFLMLIVNFVYFVPRIEKVNLFNNPDYKQLLEFGELESVFFVGDVEEMDIFIGPYTSFQTFNFHNFSVNDWAVIGRSSKNFDKDKSEFLLAIKENNCEKVDEMIKTMEIKTLALKNLPGSFPCNYTVIADLGAFKILQNNKKVEVK